MDLMRKYHNKLMADKYNIIMHQRTMPGTHNNIVSFHYKPPINKKIVLVNKPVDNHVNKPVDNHANKPVDNHVNKPVDKQVIDNLEIPESDLGRKNIIRKGKIVTKGTIM